MKHIIDGKRASSNDQLMKYLHSLVKEGDSLLDLGCGPKLYSNPFKEKCSKILTIDAWESVNPDIVADLETIDLISLLNGEKFDYVLMIDFIEHLEKSAGLKLIEDVKKITNKKIVLLTPLEEIWDDNHKNVNDPALWCYGNDFDMHKSLWDRNDFADWHDLKLNGLDQYFVGAFSND
jgi:cyclopropane fatty-acyl-phospholipid synthase-like methyltransferase